MNIKENVWEIMSRMVYSRGRQFSTVDDLEETIRDWWASVSGELVQKLYRSIPRRSLADMDARGGQKKY